jgi:hypothetical protein
MMNLCLNTVNFLKVGEGKYKMKRNKECIHRRPQRLNNQANDNNY